jgi:hypothetical protein
MRELQLIATVASPIVIEAKIGVFQHNKRTTAIDHRPTMAAFLVADGQSREPTARFRAN